MNLHPLREHAPTVAVGCAAAGMLAAIPSLQPALRAFLLGVFVLAGPGSALLANVAIPEPAQPLLVPLTGVTVVVLATWFTSYALSLTPLPVLLVLALLTVAGALVPTYRRRRGRSPV